MSIWHYLWPWGQQHKDRAEEERKIEKLFQKQLEVAGNRQKSLKEAADSLKEATERVREERERENRSSGVRVPLNSQPVLQD
jgi:hypothetical protein